VRLRVQVLRGPPSTKIFLKEDKFDFRVIEKMVRSGPLKLQIKLKRD